MSLSPVSPDEPSHAGEFTFENERNEAAAGKQAAGPGEPAPEPAPAPEAEPAPAPARAPRPAPAGK